MCEMSCGSHCIRSANDRMMCRGATDRRNYDEWNVGRDSWPHCSSRPSREASASLCWLYRGSHSSSYFRLLGGALCEARPSRMRSKAIDW